MGSLLILVLLISCINEVTSYGEKELLSLKKILRPSVESINGRSYLYQNSRTQNGATILEMKHRDTRSKPKTEPNPKHLITADDIRVKSIQSRIGNTLLQYSPSQARIPISSGIELQILNYIVTITLGGRNLTVIVDTGSDLAWVQCQPCKLCYTQPEPLFDPLTSPSYQSVHCSSQPCSSLQSATGNSGFCGVPPTCNYAVGYGDGSYTRGDLGTDRLVLGDHKVESFVFGCGRDNKGLFGSASGLIGLGRSDLSLISQTYDAFGGVFSYCLPDSDSLSSGSLVLGNDTSVFGNTTPISYTRLVENPRLSSFYVLNLAGISVGGVGLSWPGRGKDEMLIDSGTVITRVKPSIYRAVKGEFLRQFSGYPTAPGFSILDTCFNLSGYEKVNVPTLRIQFEGENAVMSVDVSGMFYFVEEGDASQVCLALASLTYESEIGIIGNFQQRNTRVVYDTKEMKLGFAKEICNFS